MCAGIFMKRIQGFKMTFITWELHHFTAGNIWICNNIDISLFFNEWVLWLNSWVYHLSFSSTINPPTQKMKFTADIYITWKFKSLSHSLHYLQCCIWTALVYRVWNESMPRHFGIRVWPVTFRRYLPLQTLNRGGFTVRGCVLHCSHIL